MSPRGLRALGVIGAAMVGLLAAGIVYLQPRVPWPTPAGDTARRPAATANRGAELCDAAFLDAARGAVILCSTVNRRLHVFLTEDGGRTWRPGPSGLVAGGQVTWFDGRHAIIAGFGRQVTYVWSTEDGGGTWGRRTAAGPPAGGTYAASLPLFGDPAWGLLPYVPDSAGSRGGPAARGLELRLTQDGGRTWTRVEGAGIPAAGAKRLLGLWGPGHGYLQVTTPGRWPALLRTDDRGASWAPAAVPAPPAPPVRLGGSGVLQGRGREVFWVQDLDAEGVDPERGRIYTSESLDGGRSWSRLRPGPAVAAGSQPRLDDRGLLWLLDRGRLWSSGGGSLDWEARSGYVTEGRETLQLAFAGGGVVYAINRTVTKPGLLVRSRDDGVRWEVIAVPPVPER